jgi:hypothetical protein
LSLVSIIESLATYRSCRLPEDFYHTELENLAVVVVSPSLLRGREDDMCNARSNFLVDSQMT